LITNVDYLILYRFNCLNGNEESLHNEGMLYLELFRE